MGTSLCPRENAALADAQWRRDMGATISRTCDDTSVFLFRQALLALRVANHKRTRPYTPRIQVRPHPGAVGAVAGALLGIILL